MGGTGEDRSDAAGGVMAEPGWVKCCGRRGNGGVGLLSCREVQVGERGRRSDAQLGRACFRSQELAQALVTDTYPCT